MVQFKICLVTVAVLLAETSANMMCIMKELMVITPDHFITDPERACRNVESKFSQVSQQLNKCSKSFDIDIGLLESLHYEFCNENSDFRQKFDRQSNCLSTNMWNGYSCASNRSTTPVHIPEKSKMKTANQLCKRVSMELTRCLTEKVGGFCGPEGLEVYGRIMKAYEPFFVGTCLTEVLGENQSLYEMSGAERRLSHLLWCLLLGFLCAMTS